MIEIEANHKLKFMLSWLSHHAVGSEPKMTERENVYQAHQPWHAAIQLNRKNRLSVAASLISRSSRSIVFITLNNFE